MINHESKTAVVKNSINFFKIITKSCEKKIKIKLL